MSPNGGRSALTAYILICAPTEVGGGFSLSAAPQFWQKYAPVCTAAWHDGHIKISWLSIIHHTSYHVIDLDGPLCECTVFLCRPGISIPFSAYRRTLTNRLSDVPTDGWFSAPIRTPASLPTWFGSGVSRKPTAF